MYRILTENKNLREIIPLCPDATIYSTIGIWHGVRERSLVIEIIGYPRTLVESLAREIQAINNQESVLIQEIPEEHYEIRPEPRPADTYAGSLDGI
jgi:hypothetical protein